MVRSEALRRGYDGPNFSVIVVSPRPTPTPGVHSLARVYVDSVNLITWDEKDVKGRHQNLLMFREECSLQRQMESLGFFLDRVSREIRVNSQRAWRLHHALRQLVKQRRCSGKALQEVIGISLSMNQRCCLSVQHGERQTDSGAVNSDPRPLQSFGVRPASFR